MEAVRRHHALLSSNQRRNVNHYVSDLPLHRLQLREVFVAVYYSATLATRTPPNWRAIRSQSKRPDVDLRSCGPRQEKRGGRAPPLDVTASDELRTPGCCR